MNNIISVTFLIFFLATTASAAEPSTIDSKAHTIFVCDCPESIGTAADLEPAPFPDIPKNHWAYESVRQLQKAGILIGYPKGTFDGNKAMTRNDFAVAITRMLPFVCGQANSLQATRQQVDDLERRISALEKGEVVRPAKTNAPAPPELCTKAEYDSVHKLVTEFSNELKKMRVDVDALKKDVAALNDRVTAAKKNKFP